MRVSMLATVLALLLLPCTGAAAVSLMQRIRESDNLTVFAKLLSDTGLASQLDGNATCATGGAPCFLVFAPSDAAFAKAAGEAARLLDQPDSRLRLANQHIVTALGSGRKIQLSSWLDLPRPAVVGRDVGLGQARILSASNGVLFWQAKETSGNWSYHANNARINVALSNREADNGVYHVLDDVALPLARDIPLLALLSLPADAVIKQMGVGRTLRIFSDWMSRDTEFQFLYDALLGGGGVRTAFLPTDAAWAALPPAAWQRLNGSTGASSGALRRAVLTAHVAFNVSLFTGWLRPQPGAAVEFVAGSADFTASPGRFVRGGGGGGDTSAAFVVVGGVVAGVGVGGANLALRDAVVHSVDRVLAAPGHRSLAEAARSLAPEFHSLCGRFVACARLLTEAESGRDGLWTLFAPVDLAGLASDGDDLVEQILLLHFVRNVRIPKYSMTDSLVVTAEGNSSGQIRFRRSANFTKLWIEGRLAGRGFVRSELLAWDEPTQSGDLVHTVRTPLGRPDSTLRQMLAQLPALSAAAARLDADGFRPKLGAAADRRNFTAFVPDNRAMAAMVAFLKASDGAGNLSGSAVPTNATALDKALRSLILPDSSILALALPLISEPATYLTADGGNATVSLTVATVAGTTDLFVWLQSGNMLVKARASSGQYQCLNGILYTAESITLQHNHRRAQMQPELLTGGGATVVTATGLVATVTAALVGLLVR